MILILEIGFWVLVDLLHCLHFIEVIGNKRNRTPLYLSEVGCSTARSAFLGSCETDHCTLIWGDLTTLGKLRGSFSAMKDKTVGILSYCYQ